MSGTQRISRRAEPSRFERAVRSVARFLYPTFDSDPQERQASRGFFMEVVRIWVVTVIILVIPALVMTIAQRVDVKRFRASDIAASSSS